MKNLPQKILAVLIIILLLLVGVTYYIQRPMPTLKRLVSKNIVLDTKSIQLDRYDTKHHPVLFKIVPKDGKFKKQFADLIKACKAQEIEPDKIPESINRVDKKLVETIKKSKPIFYSSKESNKSCLLFTQNEVIFLYLNDKF